MGYIPGKKNELMEIDRLYESIASFSFKKKLSKPPIQKLREEKTNQEKSNFNNLDNLLGLILKEEKVLNDLKKIKKNL
jgi:hypothetical protein